MADKIKPLKIENSVTGGTQNDGFPTEANPSQDYVATKGVAFENSDATLLDLDPTGEIRYKDAVQTSYKKLNDIPLILELTADPVTPRPQTAWVVSTVVLTGGSPMGLLLALTNANTTYSYKLKYRTLENTTIAVTMS